jgi:hypothetical protein
LPHNVTSPFLLLQHAELVLALRAFDDAVVVRLIDVARIALGILIFRLR